VQKRYSASTTKAVLGSPSQEDAIFFSDSELVIVSTMIHIGLFCSIAAASVVVLFLKGIRTFGWKWNQPNGCLALSVVGGFALGADCVKSAAVQVVYHYESDLAYQKALQNNTFSSCGWICYLWAIMLFVSLWTDTARAFGITRRLRCIRVSMLCVVIFGTIWFIANIVLDIVLNTLSQEDIRNLDEIDTDKLRMAAFPTWLRLLQAIHGMIGLLWFLAVIAVRRQFSRSRLLRGQDPSIGA